MLRSVAAPSNLIQHGFLYTVTGILLDLTCTATYNIETEATLWATRDEM
jgi:hypothetical protein